MKLLDLFSGIGGFSLAASWAGIETVAFCEKDAFCQQVLKKHWPSVPIVDDIFKLRGDEFGAIDIVSGGFPCQPFSVSGKRKGKDDDRHLWPEMLRVIKTARPTWVLGENVPGIIGLELDQVLSDLEGSGYETQALVIPACAVDAPHRRDRVWIMAWNSNSNRKNEKIFNGKNTESRRICKDVGHAERSGRSGKPRRGAGEITADGHKQLEEGDVADTKRKQDHREGSVRLSAIATQCRQDVANTYGQPQRHGNDDVRTIQREGSEGRKNGSTIRSRKCRAIKSGLGRMVDELPARLDNHFDE